MIPELQIIYSLFSDCSSPDIGSVTEYLQKFSRQPNRRYFPYCVRDQSGILANCILLEVAILSGECI